MSRPKAIASLQLEEMYAVTRFSDTPMIMPPASPGTCRFLHDRSHERLQSRHDPHGGFDLRYTIPTRIGSPCEC